MMYKILLAEDNPGDVYLIRQALAEANLSVELSVFEDGLEALQFVQEESASGSKVPDLILLDLNLPKNDGAEILAAVRACPGWSRIPVAILTSSRSPKDRQKAEELHAVEYILKPLNLDDFLKIGHVIKELVVKAQDQPIAS